MLYDITHYSLFLQIMIILSQVLIHYRLHHWTKIFFCVENLIHVHSLLVNSCHGCVCCNPLLLSPVTTPMVGWAPLRDSADHRFQPRVLASGSEHNKTKLGPSPPQSLSSQPRRLFLILTK